MLISLEIISPLFRYGRARLVLTFQEELARRIVARPVNREYTRLSIMCQNWCEVDHKLRISGKSFTPRPEVDVGVVKFTPRVEPLVPGLSFDLIERTVRTVFNYRNKPLKNAAKFLFPKPIRLEMVHKLLEKADLDPDMPPWSLSIEEWGRIMNIYNQMVIDDPSLENFDHTQENKRPKRLKELFKENL